MFGAHTRAFNVRGCYVASYVKSTCDIRFHESESTIASIPNVRRQKRQIYTGGSLSDIFTSFFSFSPNRGAYSQIGFANGIFDINQYVNLLPRNSVLYSIITDGE